MNPEPLPLRIARYLTWTLLGYWGLVAVVFPVMIWDAHTYNLARIEIARLEGLFGNTMWLGERQVAFPWSFDAIHLPPILMGWGYGVPSFLCLLGVVAAVHDLLSRHVSREAAIWSALTLVAMPTLVYQGVSSKNDIPVLFAVACWAVAIDRWRLEQRLRWLALGALALGFAAGAKSSGLPIAFLLGLATLLAARKKRREALVFTGACVISLGLLGSVETYVNNVQVFGEPLGPGWFVRNHSNIDGIRGAAGNVLRYTAGNLNFGLEWFRPHPPAYVWLENGTQQCLDALGLNRAGSHGAYPTVRFLKNGGEAGSDFGVPGTLAILAVLGSLISCRFRTPLFRLSLAAAIALGIVAFTTAWMPWNARFLLLPFALGACVLGLLASYTSNRSGVRWLWLAILGFSAIAAPLQSAHRYPRMFVTAVTDRDRAMTAERPAMLEIVEDLHRRANELKGGLLLHSGSDSWVFAVMHRMPFPVAPVSQIASLESAQRPNGSYLLILDKELPLLDPARYEVTKRYTQSQSFLVKILPPPSRDR